MQKTNIVTWIIIIIVVIIIPIVPVMIVGAENVTSITYVSNIDPDLGFYKITDSTLHKQAPYKDRVLTINQGDTVIWKNDADKPNNITVVSDQKLFADKLLRLIGDVSSFMFDRPGTYTFYMKERETMKQSIIVNAVEGYQIHISNNPITTNTPVTTPVTTPTIVQTPKINTTPKINIPKINITPVLIVNNTNNITNITNTKTLGKINFPEMNILFAIYGKIDIGYIINNYIAGVLAIATYVICKKKFLKQ